MQVKEYRIKKGLTQEQMAEFLGIKQASYSRKENGTRAFSSDELFTLEIILDVTINELFRDKKQEMKDKFKGVI